MQAVSPRFCGVVIYKNPEQMRLHSDRAAQPQRGEVKMEAHSPDTTYRYQIVRADKKPTPETGILYPLKEDEIALGRGAGNNRFSSTVTVKDPGSEYISSLIARELTRMHFPKDGHGRRNLDQLDQISPSGSLVQSWLGILDRYYSPDIRYLPAREVIWHRTYERKRLNRFVYEYVRTADGETPTTLKDRPLNTISPSLRFGGVVIYAKPNDIKGQFPIRKESPIRFQVIAPNRLPTRETGVNHIILEDEVAIGKGLALASKDYDSTQYFSSPIAKEITDAHFPLKTKLNTINRLSPSGALMPAWFAHLTSKCYPVIHTDDRFSHFSSSAEVEAVWAYSLEQKKINPFIYEYKTVNEPNNFQSKYKARA